ncbi:MAG: OB-fold domain-containing protein [Dehalococcoidia bacterium]|uniref:Zn-ribbon domain-containing OB-fold protein n=1 Tax=Candidatus Amarobacter glycogenicus TaxID=3140699 RepID=UPI00313553ED|nr:OB-fold domain-containing protein [Dehalococcoidia bacterium]MBK8559009.1 OB-fold domain-containing protein [Dehalococcoidia bacterium]
MSEDFPRPLPEADETSQEFWDGAMAGKLMLMRCTECGLWRLPSRPHCDGCLSDQFTWEQASGRGAVRTFGVMHQKYHPGWAAIAPYNVTIVELEEGPRLPTNVVGIPNDRIRVGMPVIVEFEQHEDVALPKFRPA